MPKSKRNKMVNLTKVKKQGRSGKEQLVEKIQDAVGEFQNSYVVSFENMRSGPFKKMQHQMHDTSRFHLGKNKVMQRALGREPEDEVEDNTHRLSRYLSGQVALCFSNLSMKEFQAKIDEYQEEDFA